MSTVLHPGVPDWLAYTSDPEYGRWMYEARRRFRQIEDGTIRQIREAYREAGRQIAEELARLEFTSGGRYRRRVQWYLDHGYDLGQALELAAPALTDANWRAAQEAINEALRLLSERTLLEIASGVRGAVGAAFEPAQQMMLVVLFDVFGSAVVSAAARQMHDRALIGLVNRTGPDGLRVSDRIWRIERDVRRQLTTVIQAGVVDGMDPRKLARRVQGFMSPGVGRPLSPATRRRLRVSRDVSMEALRLAVTEQQHAWHEASIQANHMAPGYKGIIWRLSASHPRPCECDDLARHNGNGFWPAGQEPVKPHPFCRCVAIPVLEDRQVMVQRLRRWIQDPASEPDIQRWYEGVREYLPRLAA